MQHTSSIYINRKFIYLRKMLYNTLWYFCILLQIFQQKLEIFKFIQVKRKTPSLIQLWD